MGFIECVFDFKKVCCLDVNILVFFLFIIGLWLYY